MVNDTIFWDVDTQSDFMETDGKLYVEGADKIIDKISEIRRFALEKGYSLVASTDWHKKENAEISEQADFQETFPPHCLAGESGSERVGFLGDLGIDEVKNQKLSGDELRKLVEKKQFHIVIRKEELDVFSNPNTAAIVELVKPKEIVIFGVATNLCVAYTIRGFQKFPDIKLTVLKDAVKGISEESEKEAFSEFAKSGVELTKWDELKERLDVAD